MKFSKTDLVLARIGTALWSLNAFANGVAAVVRSFFEQWGSVGLHLALCLLMSSGVWFWLRPRSRKITRELRGRRIAELENELGIF